MARFHTLNRDFSLNVDFTVHDWGTPTISALIRINHPALYFTCSDLGLPYTKDASRKTKLQLILENIVLPEQKRIYVGPLSDDVTGSDLTLQFQEFGRVEAVSVLNKASSDKRSFGFVDFSEVISVRRSFSAKVFVKGRHVKVSLSKMAMEVVLNESAVFFFDAFVFCDDVHLEQHFSTFGPIFRCMHLTDSNSNQGNKSFGFVDFVSPESAAKAERNRTQLLFPGQYVKVSKILPQQYLYELLAIGDTRGMEILAKLDRVIPNEGTWGGKQNRRELEHNHEVITAKVRIPAKMVGRLIGERGKTIAEITRDSKTKITIPRTEEGGNSVVVAVTGLKRNITTAQFLMKKVIQG